MVRYCGPPIWATASRLRDVALAGKTPMRPVLCKVFVASAIVVAMAPLVWSAAPVTSEDQAKWARHALPLPDDEPVAYTKSLTFLRCSATDCAANGFNSNDTSENTCLLYCRIDGAAWHAYEGAGRVGFRFAICGSGTLTIGV